VVPTGPPHGVSGCATRTDTSLRDRHHTAQTVDDQMPSPGVSARSSTPARTRGWSRGSVRPERSHGGVVHESLMPFARLDDGGLRALPRGIDSRVRFSGSSATTTLAVAAVMVVADCAVARSPSRSVRMDRSTIGGARASTARPQGQCALRPRRRRSATGSHSRRPVRCAIGGLDSPGGKGAAHRRDQGPDDATLFHAPPLRRRPPDTSIVRASVSCVAKARPALRRGGCGGSEPARDRFLRNSRNRHVHR
jgi:hypothetical protein